MSFSVLNDLHAPVIYWLGFVIFEFIISRMLALTEFLRVAYEAFDPSKLDGIYKIYMDY